MGFLDTSRGFRYYKPESRQVLVSRNVVFAPWVQLESGEDGEDEGEDEPGLAGLPAEGGDLTSSSSSESEESSSE